MAEGGLFGRIAIEKGFVSEEALARALRAQEEIATLGFRKQLGEILVEDGALGGQDVEVILRLQQVNQRLLQDKRFTAIAIKNKLVTREQVAEATDVVREEGFRRSIREVLVERGWLEPVAARAIRQAMEKIESRRKGPAAAAPASPEERGTTARLGAALDVQVDEDRNEDAIERRIRDVLFAAVAFREGLVLVSELERAVRDQTCAEGDPPLWSVLGERGTLGPAELQRVAEALETARTEKIAIPGYKLQEVIGRGVTSIVLRARHELIDRDVAIKIFRRDHAAATDDDEALVAEAKVIARIRHPHVVGLYDVGRVHRRLYYVMELVDGATLQDEIRARGHLSEPEALGIGREVASALEAIHEVGLVHRDVKPQNILIADGGHAKLTDLGLARATGEAAEVGSIVGTPSTIAPEQANGDRVDIRADLYSLGATLFHALTGQPPYDGQDVMSVLVRHATEAIPDPRVLRPELSRRTATLVMTLMAKKPEDRPESPHAVVEAIDLIRVGTGSRD